MLRIRAIVSIVVMLSLIAITGGGLRGSVAVATTTLAATRSFPSPEYNVQGLAHGGGSLWAATPSEYDPSTGGYSGIISEIDPASGAVRKSFAFPTTVTGLTHDGTFLYATREAGTVQCGDTNLNTIAVIDPATGEIVRSIPSPISGGTGGLATLNGTLFAVGALNLDPCANNGAGASVGVVIAEVNPADGTLLRYLPVDNLGILPRELDANGTNLLYGTGSSAGLTVYTLAPTLTGEVLQTAVLAVPSDEYSDYEGPDVKGLAGSANELFVANRYDGRIYVFALTETTSQTLPAGGTLSSDAEGDGATASDPVETSVTSPNGGALTITETATTETAPGGYSFLGQQINLSGDPASVENPYVVTFRIDSSQIPVGENQDTMQIFRNGEEVSACADTLGTATPDPCVSKRELLADGDIAITVLTSQFSAWNFGVSIVSYELKGFHNPVNMNGTANTAKAGSTIPIKFEVFEDGRELTDTSVVKSIGYKANVGCTAASEDAIEDLTETTGLRYVSSSGQFVYGGQTPKTAGCYNVVVKTVDGSQLTALFELK